MESNTISYKDLDKKLEKRFKIIQRKFTLLELEYSLNFLELNAKKRVTEELFIKVTSFKRPVQILNANQKFKFIFVTLQEIQLNVDSFLMGGLFKLPHIDCRLTSYQQFKERGEKLVKMIEAGKLDDHIQFSASEILYRIMGNEGELLERLGIDKNENYSIDRVTQIFTEKYNQYTRLHDLFESISEPTNNQKSVSSINPIPPLLCENFKWVMRMQIK